MTELPVVAEAVADGTLSFDKARSVAKVAAPDTESALVELALHATVAQTQRICGSWRKVEQRSTTGPDPDGPVEARPTVLVVHDDDGIELRVRFDHVHGQLVVAPPRRLHRRHPRPPARGPPKNPPHPRHPRRPLRPTTPNPN